MNANIPLFRIQWENSDLEAVNKIISSGSNWAAGPVIAEFEKKLAENNGSRFAVVFNSGTSALHAILYVLGITQNDEVIVPSFSFISTANAPLFVGAKPVFADIEPVTLGLDPEDVRKKITHRTRAIIAVHYGGCPCQIEALCKIASDHGLYLIEDTAEAQGSSVFGKKTGTFGIAGMLSFCQNKIISTGEGGAIVTDSDEIYRKLKLFCSHGRMDSDSYFSTTTTPDYIGLGYNFRMPTMNASLGLSQLERIEKLIALRKKVADLYNECLEGVNELERIQIPDNYSSVHQLYSIFTNRQKELIEYLEKCQIMSKIYFSPIHQTNFYKKILKTDVQLPITECISQKIVSIPMFPTLQSEEISFIASCIKKFFKESHE